MLGCAPLDEADADHATDAGPDAGDIDSGQPDAGVTASQVSYLLSRTCGGLESYCHVTTPDYDAGCYFDGGLNRFETQPLTSGPYVDIGFMVNTASIYSPKLRVKPFAPDESFLMDKLQGHLTTCEGVQMPQGSMLSPDQIELIRQWIAEGAPLQ